MRNLNNHVRLIGNLGAAPQINTTTNGNKLARLSVATNRRVKNKDGEYEQETMWHRCTAWNNLAGIAEKFLNSGSFVLVEGRIQYSNYTDKDGNKRTSTEIVVEDLLMLDGKNKAN